MNYNFSALRNPCDSVHSRVPPATEQLRPLSSSAPHHFRIGVCVYIFGSGKKYGDRSVENRQRHGDQLRADAPPSAEERVAIWLFHLNCTYKPAQQSAWPSITVAWWLEPKPRPRYTLAEFPTVSDYSQPQPTEERENGSMRPPWRAALRRGDISGVARPDCGE
jgi:hypothetical protein